MGNVSRGMYVNIKIGRKNNNVKLLVDTGASICLIKRRFLKNSFLNLQDQITINGITGSKETLGSQEIQLNFENLHKWYKFHIVDDNFPVEGIIGADFLRDVDAIIDLEKAIVRIKINNSIIKMPLIKQEESKFLTLPARCESTYFIDTKYIDERVFQPEELCEGVFMAGSVSKAVKGKIPVRLLNTREEKVTLSWYEPISLPACDYFVFTYSRTKTNQPSRVDRVLKEINMDNMNSEEKLEIKSICTKFNDIFHLDGDNLTFTSIAKAQINLKSGTIPKYKKPYRLPHAQKQEIKDQVKKMVDDNIAEPSMSPWNSPILVVPKKKDPVTGLQKLRLVIDYRGLNDAVEDDKFPLPNITDIYDLLGGAVYFSCLDLSQGYYQMELDDNSKPLTAFSTENGHFQLTRLPMGLKTSPSAFSRMMSIAMSGLTSSRCFVYLDDIIVFGKNLREHNRNLMEVFERLREVNLKIHPGKCSFLKTEVLYLGHLISDKGILPDPTKSEVMKNYPQPKNADEVRRFVAFANYYRKFIQNFAAITCPLNKLLRKDIPFVFDKDCVSSFETLRKLLASPEILQFPNFDEDFILRTDASGYAIGAVLSNYDDQPIAYASRALNKAEKNYSTIEKELLAIVWSVQHYRPYLFGRHFNILTDHRPLVYLFSLKEPSSRLTKFRLLLEEYNFTVTYTKGKDNGTADALSRIEVKNSELKEIQICVATRSQTKKENKEIIENTNEKNIITDLLKPPEVGLKLIEIKFVKEIVGNMEFKGLDMVTGPHKSVAYIPDRNCILLKFGHDASTITRSASFDKMLLRDVRLVTDPLRIKKVFITKEECIKIINGRPEAKYKRYFKELFKPTGIVVEFIEKSKKVTDPNTKKLIMNDYHILPTSGHAGINRMIRNIKKEYYWTGMQQDITTYVKNCDSCQRNKHINKKRQPLVITSTADSSFEKIFIDLVGPLETSLEGYKYILTIQDELTKFIEAIPIVNKEANTVAKGLVYQFILRYGVPKVIASDQGTEFINEVFKNVCKLLKIKQLTSTAYHHESIGALENTHKVLGAYLRAHVTKNHSDWDSWLQYYVFCYNTSIHSETGYTPHELVYGQNCILPSNLISSVEPMYNYEDYAKELKNKLQVVHSNAKEILIKKKTERKLKYDQNVKARDIDLAVGSLVLLKNETRKKLDPIYTGPYEVVSQDSVNCTIKYKGKNTIVHKNRIKPYYS